MAGNEKRARQRVAERSEDRCEICGIRPGQSWHHRRKRTQSGLWLPSNGLHLCGDGTVGCHGMVTNTRGHVAEYQRNGWMVPSWADPAVVPVLLANVRKGRVWCLLDDAGGFEVVSAEHAAQLRAQIGLPDPHVEG